MIETAIARRKVRKIEERNLQARVDNQRAFQTIVAQAFDRDTVLLRCEALAAFVDMNWGCCGYKIKFQVDIFRRSPDARRWDKLEQRVGFQLNDKVSSGGRTQDFEKFWGQWRAS